MAEEPKTPTKPLIDVQRRLRVLEERYTVLRRKNQLVDENFLRVEEELRKEMNKLNEEYTELRRLVIDIDDKLDRFLEQVKTTASREEVLVLKKYLEMWDPVQYLTHEEARRLLETQ